MKLPVWASWLLITTVSISLWAAILLPLASAMAEGK